jgi:hypothetical protein
MGRRFVSIAFPGHSPLLLKAIPSPKLASFSMDRVARFFREWNQRLGRVVRGNASAHPRMERITEAMRIAT